MAQPIIKTIALQLDNLPPIKVATSTQCEDKQRESSIGVDVKRMGLSIGNVECAGSLTSGAILEVIPSPYITLNFTDMLFTFGRHVLQPTPSVRPPRAKRPAPA